jgi:hypothetical protein
MGSAYGEIEPRKATYLLARAQYKNPDYVRAKIPPIFLL